MKPDSSVGPVLRLAEFLPYRLNVLASLASEGLARQYQARFGIGIPEWRVLATLGEFGAMTATAIGQHAHMGKVKVSRAVTALAARDMVARAPNGADGRGPMLSLTAQGRVVYGQIAPLAAAYAAALTAGMSDSELARVDQLLRQLTDRAAQLQDAGTPR